MHSINVKVVAILLAGGKSERLKANVPKQFLKIAAKEIIEHTTDIFHNSPLIDGIVIVCNPNFISHVSLLVKKNNWTKVIALVPGGRTRQESSYNGIQACPTNTKYLLIHDSVRPLVTENSIQQIINALEKYKCVNLVAPPRDTIIQTTKDGKFIRNIPPRELIKRGLSPQGFHYSVIRTAHEMANNDIVSNISDDCGLVMKYDLANIFIVTGSENNIKVTYKSDIYLIEKLLTLQVDSQKDRL